MNTKRLMKTKADDASPETTNSKSKKSIQLADTSPTPAIKAIDENELITTDKKVIDQIGQLTRNYTTVYVNSGMTNAWNRLQLKHLRHRIS